MLTVKLKALDGVLTDRVLGGHSWTELRLVKSANTCRRQCFPAITSTGVHLAATADRSRAFKSAFASVAPSSSLSLSLEAADMQEPADKFRLRRPATVISKRGPCASLHEVGHSLHQVSHSLHEVGYSLHLSPKA